VNVFHRKFPLAVAVIHSGLFLLTFLYVEQSTDGQAAMVWIYWVPVDFPISLVYFVLPMGAYSQWLDSISEFSPFLARIFYLPHFVHGILGVVWWYFLALVISRGFSRWNFSRQSKKLRSNDLPEVVDSDKS
jgi:hypothetical protein